MVFSCDKCGSIENIEEHHIVPKSLGNPKSLKNGKKIWLCQKHHDILGKMLLKVVWKYVDEEKKEECKEEIKRFTNWWLKK